MEAASGAEEHLHAVAQAFCCYRRPPPRGASQPSRLWPPRGSWGALPLKSQLCLLSLTHSFPAKTLHCPAVHLRCNNRKPLLVLFFCPPHICFFYISKRLSWWVGRSVFVGKLTVDLRRDCSAYLFFMDVWDVSRTFKKMKTCFMKRLCGDDMTQISIKPPGFRKEFQHTRSIYQMTLPLSGGRKKPTHSGTLAFDLFPLPPPSPHKTNAHLRKG